MTNEQINQIRAYFDAHKEEIIKDLKELVSYPSIESAPLPGAPFGQACRDALDAAVDMFNKEGFESSVCSEGKYGIAKKAGNNNDIGIFGHLDVVPVTEDWILNPPFEPQEHDGCLVGRGIHDNKAGVIMSLYALRAIRDLGLPFKSGVTVFLGANEESGMQDIEAFCQEQPMPTVSIVPDNAYPICLGEKGIYHLWAKANTPLTAVRKIEGGLAVNVILDKVEAEIEYSDERFSELYHLVKGNERFVLRKTGNSIFLFAQGITAHGSMPKGSLNAGKLLLSVLTQCSSLPQSDVAILKGALSFLEKDYGEPFGIAAEDKYFGKTTATNGIFSTLDGILSLSFDIRYGSVSSPEFVEKSVRESILNANFTPYREENRPGFRIDENEPTAIALINAYRAVSKDLNSSVIYSGGGTYARHLKNAFSCGCEAPYLRKELDLPKGHGDIHQSDESISIEGLLESILLFTVMLIELDASL